ncbi:MAG TPA: hypothetical protein VL094_09105 [Sphingomonadaceae bacterium]|nr:hypothetical protein [Sphingomonadaceae bacterium]
MSVQFSNLAAQVAEDGKVTPEDILALRRLGWESGDISLHEAEAIFALNRQLAEPRPEWVDFFVEALSEFVVNGTPPKGYVDEGEANWLIEALDKDGRLESMAELELLVRVMERAINVPDSLKHYALRQIEHAVLLGTGPTRDGGQLSDQHITDAECRLLRRIIFSSGGLGAASASRHDAEMLFRLKDAALGKDNSPEWKRLFVQGVGNYLMGFSSRNAQLDHARARELEAFIADNRASTGRFFGRMVRSMPNAFGAVFGRKEAEPGHDEQVAAARRIDQGEQGWLDAQIDANGQLDELDRALLDFIEEELGG